MKILFAFFILINCPFAIASKTLVVGVHPGLTFPDYKVVNGKPVGIIPSLINPFAEKEGYKVKYKMVPRKRLDKLITSGEVHIRCLCSKNWISRPGDFHWSKLLFQEESNFVRRVDGKEISQFSDLKGLAVAGILGFIYGPELTAMIEKGEVERSDVINVKNLISMVTKKRTDVAVESKRVLKHLLKNEKELVITQLVQGREEHHCLFTKKLNKDLVDKFNDFYSDEKLLQVMDQYL